MNLSMNAYIYVMCSGRDSRIAYSENSSPVSDKKLLCLKEEETDVVLTCCQECKSDYEKESVHHKSFSDKESAASPQLPYWLKPHANQPLEKVLIFTLLILSFSHKIK